MNLYDELMYRGLINDISSEDLKEKLNKGGMTFYIGTDPTGDSLHIGHYSSFLISKRLAKAGHHPILLVGGATGLIGDPKPSAERPMITKEQVQHNFDCLKKQATELFGFEVVNNYDWCKDLNFNTLLKRGRVSTWGNSKDSHFCQLCISRKITMHTSFLIRYFFQYFWFGNLVCSPSVIPPAQAAVGAKVVFC